jgi:hypothetical protein
MHRSKSHRYFRRRAESPAGISGARLAVRLRPLETHPLRPIYCMLYKQDRWETVNWSNAAGKTALAG